MRRVVLESLTNVMKHCLARRADVCVTSPSDGSVLVVVRDPGPPRPHAADGSLGHGLSGMRSAHRRRGGSLVVGPNVGGYRVEAELPARATSPAIP